MKDPSDTKALAVPASRLGRMARLGGLTAGVAGNMALNGARQLGRGQRPDMRNLLLTPRNMSRVADELAKMRGAAMKVGQLMSMDTGDLFPPEITDILARLRNDAHFMPPAQLKKVLAEQWHTNWIRDFARFDVRPIAAASIGQVHRAQLKDGRDVAIKVQYPGVARSIDSDVANVGALIKLTGLLPKGFDLDPYLAEAAAQLHEETDYTREAHYQSQFQSLLEATTDVVIPSVHADFSTSSILAMEYVESQSVEDCISLPQSVRDQIATSLFDLMLRELFEFGVMQTDPNFANYRYQPEHAKIVVLDFGATRILSPQIISLYTRLIQAGLDRDAEKLTQIGADLGLFDAQTQDKHRDAMLGMMQSIFDDILESELYDFGETQIPKSLQTQGLALADDGFIPPPLPIDAVFLQRKFAGMFLLAARLQARVRLSDLIVKHLAS